MLRLVRFFLVIICVAVALSWLIESDGLLTIDWLGYHIESSLAFAVTLALAVALLVGIAAYFILWLKNTPHRLVNSYKERRKIKATQALIEGFSAVAMEDAATARKLAARADQSLPVTALLQAQAAYVAEDGEATAKYLSQMLTHKETELIGIKGLLYEAQKAKKWDEALVLANRACNLKPEAKWANLALIDLYKQTGRWVEAQQAVEDALQHHSLAKEQYKHEMAVLSYIQAKESAEQGLIERATALAKESHHLLPSFLPTSILYAELLLKQEKTRAAIKIIEEGWHFTPHPDLAALMLRVYDNEAVDKKIKRLSALALLNSSYPESHSSVANFLIGLGALDKAREHLRIALSKGENVTLCKLMAKLELKAQTDPEKAEEWLERALVAPLGTVYLCTHCSSYAAEWTTHCSTCGTFDSLRWTPSSGRVYSPSAKDRDLLAYAASGSPI